MQSHDFFINLVRKKYYENKEVVFVLVQNDGFTSISRMWAILKRICPNNDRINSNAVSYIHAVSNLHTLSYLHSSYTLYTFSHLYAICP